MREYFENGRFSFLTMMLMFAIMMFYFEHYEFDSIYNYPDTEVIQKSAHNMGENKQSEFRVTVRRLRPNLFGIRTTHNFKLPYEQWRKISVGQILERSKDEQ